ncbi:MAG: 3-oxoadipate enol-lactonase [Beijerinckiaceae bacterium]
MQRPSANSLQIDGIRLTRRGQGRPLVLLHCLGVDQELWRIAANRLEDRFEILSYDFPGHGGSPVPTHAYGIEDLSDQLSRLVEREKLGRFSLGGISLGGLVAQHYAATHPDKLDRLILIDTTARYTEEQRANWVERARIAREAGVSAMIEPLLDIWFTQEFVQANSEAVRYVRQCFERIPGEAYARACEALGRADLRDLTGAIKAPTLIVCGRDDIPSFREAARDFESAIAGAKLVWLEPARHASVLEQPEAFAAAARKFLLA